MAYTKKTTQKETIDEEVKTSTQEEKVNLNDSFLVTNLCNWQISYARISNSGDETFKPKQTKPIIGKELEAQFLNSTVFYVGTEMGKHCRLQIKDKALRDYFVKLGYLDENYENYMLDKKRCKEIISAPSLREFNSLLDDYVVEKFEQRLFVQLCHELDLNNYKYIQEIEKRFNIKY